MQRFQVNLSHNNFISCKGFELIHHITTLRYARFQVNSSHYNFILCKGFELIHHITTLYHAKVSS